MDGTCSREFIEYYGLWKLGVSELGDGCNAMQCRGGRYGRTMVVGWWWCEGSGLRGWNGCSRVLIYLFEDKEVGPWGRVAGHVAWEKQMAPAEGNRVVCGVYILGNRSRRSGPVRQGLWVSECLGLELDWT
jgi:hypothetical protein